MLLLLYKLRDNFDWLFFFFLKKRPGTFNKNNALYRLYNDYVKKYRVKIEASLNNEYLEPAIVSTNKHLNYRLQQVIYLMDAIEVWHSPNDTN